LAEVYLEVGAKRVFAGAFDWPGWIRSGKDEALALQALAAAADRYAPVARAAGFPIPANTADSLTVVERVTAIAKQHGVSNAQVALAWVLAQPGITSPIVGASKMYQLDEAIAATDITLSTEEVKRLEDPYIPHRVLGHV